MTLWRSGMETRDEMIRWNEGKLKKWDRPLSILYQGGQNTGCRLPFDDESFDVVIL